MGKKLELHRELKELELKLDFFAPLLETMERDIHHAFSAVKDGYYKEALTEIGSITEAILKDTWRKEKISGSPQKKALEPLLTVIRNKIEIDRLVDYYFTDIQRTRNRAAHGEKILIADCTESLRKLEPILDWYCKKYVGNNIPKKEDKSPTGTQIDKTIQNDGPEVENKSPQKTPLVKDRNTTTVKIEFPLELPRLSKPIRSLIERSRKMKLPNSPKEIKEKAQDRVQKLVKKGRNAYKSIKEKLESGTKE
jgi:HEPN domain-containing protein